MLLLSLVISITSSIMFISGVFIVSLIMNVVVIIIIIMIIIRPPAGASARPGRPLLLSS